MDVVYRLGRVTAIDVRNALPDAPSNTAVRTLLTILEQKGHLTHIVDGPRYIYEPTVPREEAAKDFIGGMLQTFFDGSIERAVTTLLNTEEANLTDDQLERLAALIELARKEGR